jgi:hypothetical protein
MPSPDTLPPTGVTWSRIEPDFHVASSAGNFLGYVDTDGNGAFLAYNMRSEVIGSHSDVAAAMLAVTLAGSATESIEPWER